MSKIIPIFTLFFLYGINLFAQCNPDTSIHKAGFYPKTLPDAEVKKLYQQTINFKIFKDTTVIVFGSPQIAIVDSAVIVKVDNMPPGLSFQLNKTSQSYTPEEVGCAYISGTPTKVGKYTLDIIISFYAKVLGFPVFQADTINTFSINVTGTSSVRNFNIANIEISPNPVWDDELNIKINNNIAENKILIFDSKGTIVRKLITKEKDSKINFVLPQGIYNIIINNCSYRILKR